MKPKVERRKDEELAEIFRRLGLDRRHSESECEPNEERTACRLCGRPMTHFETLINRAI